MHEISNADWWDADDASLPVRLSTRLCKPRIPLNLTLSLITWRVSSYLSYQCLWQSLPCVEELPPIKLWLFACFLDQKIYSHQWRENCQLGAPLMVRVTSWRLASQSMFGRSVTSSLLLNYFACILVHSLRLPRIENCRLVLMAGSHHGRGGSCMQHRHNGGGRGGGGGNGSRGRMLGNRKRKKSYDNEPHFRTWRPPLGTGNYIQRYSLFVEIPEYILFEDKNKNCVDLIYLLCLKKRSYTCLNFFSS